MRIFIGLFKRLILWRRVCLIAGVAILLGLLSSGTVWAETLTVHVQDQYGIDIAGTDSFAYKANASSFCDNVTEIPLAECEALVALYNSMDGPNWTNKSGWLVTNTPCSWYGVVCSGGHVKDLSLNNNQLSGSIPPELGNLASLERLYLQCNQLSGSIPPELGNLASLQVVFLYMNQLSGSIPPELGNLASLREVYLHSNKLSGSIPPQLGSLANLAMFHLADNRLSGNIPPQLGNLASLRYLYLNMNQLSGSIPPELGDLASLETLTLNSNQLSGSIPPELGNLASLQYLDLWNNQLSGSIPPELGNLASLQYLSLGANQLSGSIPPELGNLANLQRLFLNINQLSGSIPPELGNLTSLQWLYLEVNQLAGEIPTAMTNLTGLTGTALGYNMLSASNPAVIAFLASKDPDWDQTQTVPPTNVHVDSVTQTSVTLVWTPILYTGHGGYYEVGYGTIPGGPYDSVGCTTSSKSATGCPVGGLSPGTTYYFAVRTFTPAHDAQQNDLLSFYGEELAVTTAPPPNTPPVADADGPYDCCEGAGCIFDGSGSTDPDPDDSIDLYEWDFDYDGVTFTVDDSGPTLTNPSHSYADGPASKTVALRVTDSYGAQSDIATSEANVHNVAPVVGEITAPVDPVEVYTPVDANACFTDSGVLDTHTAVWHWGDGSQCDTSSDPDCAVTESAGSGCVSGSHAYTTPGVYTVELTVTDKDGGSDQSVFQFVVVYDPEGGFVTGGGWINSPEGAYAPDPTLTGKATFGFVAKYKKGADTPTGQTEFRFRVADLNFHSDTYQWLVVAGPKAQFKGTGTINGAGNYGFMLTAIDAELTPSTEVDKFRIKIWDKDDDDTIVYDNQMDAADDADPATAIGGGSIVIHEANQ
jgi:Leucine-rich repeat (LRR) protein